MEVFFHPDTGVVRQEIAVYLETRVKMKLARPRNYYVFMHVANVFSR